MTTLAIEISNPSSGPRGRVKVAGRAILAGPGVALSRPESAPDAELLNETGRHDDDLMPAIDRLFRRAGARPADLEAIAISIGPGGYTSLRIAIATAKLMAQATGARILPIPSAHIAAFLVAPDAASLVCLASKGDTAHATLLPAGPHRFETSRTLGLIDAAGIVASGCTTLIADRFIPDSFRVAAARAGIPVIEPVFAAQTLLTLARGIAPIDPIDLAPLYPRQAEAVTQWRLRHPVPQPPKG